MAKNILKILFASYEVAPFFKVGGLADVIGSLPKALCQLGVDARIIMPYYQAIKKNEFNLKKIANNLKITVGDENYCINLYESHLPSSPVPLYFIEEKKLLSVANIFDNNERARFVLFSRLIAEFLPSLGWQPDIVHCHDWQTALVVVALKKQNKIKTIFTIHNIGYQGKTDLAILEKFGWAKKDFLTLKNDQVNLLAEAILSADKVSTVSPTYAQEILTADYGYNLAPILKGRQRDLFGIINGLDEAVFGPEKDKFIKAPYTLNSLNKKQINKNYLQKISGLPAKKEIPLLGIVTRLAGQKGLDLLCQIFEALMALDLEFVILGTGDPEYEKFFGAMNKKYPAKFKAHLTFDAKLANQIYAGSDIFLMPSKYEPCGLGQMIAMRYGTIPIVRATGGLKDTVIRAEIQMSNVKSNPKLKIQNIKTANGFCFNNYNSQELLLTIQQAIDIFHRQVLWTKLIKNAMRQDFSWARPAKEYLTIYQKLI